MTTARDVTEARAIANEITLTVSTSNSPPVTVDRDDATARIAAALAERERETVERCALIAENWIASIFPKDTPVDCETVEHMLVNNAENIAAAIRAARRESET